MYIYIYVCVSMCDFTPGGRSPGSNVKNGPDIAGDEGGRPPTLHQTLRRLLAPRSVLMYICMYIHIYIYTYIYGYIHMYV